MTARVIRESYDGGKIEVEPYDRTTRPYAHPTADGCIVLDVTERGLGEVVLHLTRAESDALIDALIAANQEIDAAAHATQNTRSPAPSVAEDRATAAGLSNPPPDPGRPATCGCGRIFPKAFGLRVHQRTCTQYQRTCTQQAPIVVEQLAANPNVCEHGYRFENALCPDVDCGASAYVPDAVAAVLRGARDELLANSTPIGRAR